MITWIVVDTSYLLELFKVPGSFTAQANIAIRARFDAAFGASARLYVPVPVIFELANHIADVADGAARRRLSMELAQTIKSCHDTSIPWLIVPTSGDEILEDLSNVLALCDSFSTEFAMQKCGLTDTSVAVVARELKRRALQYPANSQPVVHIWTRDHALKAHEPDKEPFPFV